MIGSPFIFPSIMPRSPSHSAALRHRARIPYFLASCSVSFVFSGMLIGSPDLFRHCVRFPLVFPDNVSKFLQLSPALCLDPIVHSVSMTHFPQSSLLLGGDKIVGHLGSSLEFILLLHRLHFALIIHSFIHSTEEGHIFRPSLLSLDTWIFPLGVTFTHRSHIAPLGPLLGLVGVRASCGLSVFEPHVACLWSIMVCMWFILEGHHGHFPGFSHHAIGRKWGHPDVLA